MQRTPEEYKAAYLHHKNSGNADKAARVAQLYRQQLADQPKDGAFGYSVDQAQRMAGKGIEAAGRAFNSKAIADYGTGVVKQQDRDIAIGRYTPSYTKSLRETYNQDGLGAAAGWLGEKTAENAASAGTALGGAALTALTAPASMPLAAVIGGATTLGSAAMGAGEAAFEQEEKTGDYDAKLASGVGVLIGILDKFGAGKVIPKDRLMKMTAEQISAELSKKGFGEAAKTVLKRTGSEALTETAQEGLSVASAAVRGGEYTPEELGDRALEAAALGGTTSLAAQGGMGTIGAATNLVRGSNTSSAPADQEAAASFAQRLAEIAEANGYDLQDIDKMSSQGARETVDKAHIQYTEDLKQLFADLKSRVAVTDQDSLEEVAQKVLAAAAYREGRNKTKSTVGVQEMSALESLAGDTREGQQALSVLRQLNQLTKLHNDGYQGGVSAITDQFAIAGGGIGYDKGAVATERLLRPLLSGSAALSTGGTSLLGQAAVQGTGRMIDKITGRRSVVDRFVKQNQGQPGIPGSTSPSLREESIAAEQAAAQEAEALQAQQEAQAQEEANLNEYVFNQGGLPNDQSPAGTMSSVLGIDPEQMMTMLDEIIATEPNPQIVDAAIAAQGSIVQGGRVPNLNQLISMMKLRVNPDPQFWIERDRSAGQAAAQNNLSRQEQNYQRGIENNQAFNQELQNAVDDDGSIPPLNKAYLKSALADLARDLGAQPLDMVNSIIERAVEKGVTQEQMQSYLAPYLERVQQQQEAKNSRDQAAAEVDADPISAARVVPVPFNNVGMQGAFGVDQPTPGGNFIDLDTKADLTGNTYAGGSVKIIDGKPLLETSDTSTAPATKESGNKVKVNLFKKKAGWSWVDYDGPDTIVSTEQGGKHHYSLSSDFQTPVTLQTYPKQPSEPRLRPTSQGKVVLGNKIGSISVRGKVHPVYDQVTIEDKRGVDPINENKTPVLQLDTSPTIIPVLDGTETPPKLSGKTEVARYLESRAKDRIGSVRDISNPEDRSAIADDMVAEAIYEMEQQDEGSAMDWYDSTIEKMLGMMALKYPEIETDINAKTPMLIALSIMSQNMDVPTNLKIAEKAYEYFRDNGKFEIFGQGKSSAVMELNFEKANILLEKIGSMAGLENFLKTKFTVKDLNPVLQEYLGDMGAVGGENVDTEVYGSAVFGPKVGNGFYTNLRGDFSPVTMDMWFMRTVGRLRGKVLAFDEAKFQGQLNRLKNALGRKRISRDALIDEAFKLIAKHEKDFKANRDLYDLPEGHPKRKVKSEATLAAYTIKGSLRDTVDAPASGTERNELRKLVQEAVEKFNAQTGLDIQPAAFQALIWYPEQDLYKSLGVKLKNVRKDFASSLKELLIKEGFDEADLNAAIDRVQQSREQRARSVRQSSVGDDARTAGRRSPEAGRPVQGQEDPANPAIKPGTGILSSAVSDYFKQPTPSQIKEQVEPAEQIAKFVLGKPGTEFENGLSTMDQYVELAKLLNVTVGVVDSMKGDDVGDGTLGFFQGMLSGTAGKIKILKDQTPISFLQTVAHEVGHALEGSTLDRLEAERSWSPRHNHPQASRAKGDYSARQNTLRDKMQEVLFRSRHSSKSRMRYNDGLPEIAEAKKIRKEIDELQNGTLVSFGNAPELGSIPIRENYESFLTSIYENSGWLQSRHTLEEFLTGPANKSYEKQYNAYNRYKKGTEEFIVDPVHFYLMNPKQMKATLPETFKFMRDIFNKSSMPIEMHANPMMTVIALLLAGFGKALSGEEEEDRPQGVLTPQPALLTT